MNGPTITIQYSCRNGTCGTVDRNIEVLARAPDEDVRVWVEYLQHAVGGDHLRFRCASMTCDLKIPLPTANSPLGSAPNVAQA